MKYFTKQVWIDAQQPGEAGLEVGRRYEEAFAAYARELESLRHRLAPDVFDFFQNADVHDGGLIHVHLRDARACARNPATGDRDGTAAATASEDDRCVSDPVTVEVSVAEWSATVWTLRYSEVRRVLVDFPSESPLFYSPGDGFQDWGYHELSDAGDGFVRHEVLFSSGAVVLVEFRNLSVSRAGQPS